MIYAYRVEVHIPGASRNGAKDEPHEFYRVLDVSESGAKKQVTDILSRMSLENGQERPYVTVATKELPVGIHGELDYPTVGSLIMKLVQLYATDQEQDYKKLIRNINREISSEVEYMDLEEYLVEEVN